MGASAQENHTIVQPDKAESLSGVPRKLKRQQQPKTHGAMGLSLIRITLKPSIRETIAGYGGITLSPPLIPLLLLNDGLAR